MLCSAESVRAPSEANILNLQVHTCACTHALSRTRAFALQATLATVAQLTGITTMTLMATSKFIFQRGGWAVAAMVTPLAMLLSGGVFFASAIATTGGASMLRPEVRKRSGTGG